MQPGDVRPSMGSRDIVVEVRGGAVTNVYTDIPGAHVVLVDWDIAGFADDRAVAAEFVHSPSNSITDEARREIDATIR